MVWHGADPVGVRARQTYCEAWHSDIGLGLASDMLKSELMGQEKVGCNNKLVVLCVEIASQHQYRRRRDVHIDPQIDLTYEQYSHFLEQYNQQPLVYV